MSIGYNAETGVLFVGAIAYRSIDKLRLIQRVRMAETPKSTSIILSQVKISKELMSTLDGKYWVRDPWQDRVVKEVSDSNNTITAGV